MKSLTKDQQEPCENACEKSVIYGVPKKIPITFHNGSNYDFHFISS